MWLVEKKKANNKGTNNPGDFIDFITSVIYNLTRSLEQTYINLRSTPIYC